MVQKILHFVAEPWKDSTRSPNYMGAVCRFVCRLWKGLLPSPSQHNVLPLDFAAAVSLEGNLPLLRWARANRCPWGPNAIAAAASGGHLDLIKWASENGCPMAGGDACFYAAKKGHLDTLRWLREQGCPWVTRDIMFLIGPSKGGHLHVIEWAIAQGCHLDGFEWAACNNHLHVLEWVHSKAERGEGNDYRIDPLVYDLAARKGHIEVMRWAKDKGIPWSDRCWSEAAKAGRLESLRWLRENECPWDPREVCRYAAAGGHLDVLKWARENGADWDSKIFGCAAAGGHLGVLEWAKEKGCPFPDDKACLLAAKGGHLDCLIWLDRNGEAPKQGCIIAAIEEGHLEVVKWLISSGCSYVVGQAELFCWRAAINGHWEVHEWLKGKGFASDPVYAARLRTRSRLCGRRLEGFKIMEVKKRVYLHALKTNGRESGMPWWSAGRW